MTAGWLLRRLKYAVLIAFVAAAFLTSSPDPWNRAIVAAPILAMYVVSIAVAWAARPRSRDETCPLTGAMELVISAAAFEQARVRRNARRERRWTNH